MSTVGELTGRDGELQAVRDAVAAWPAVVLTGAAGVGKSRLLQAVVSQLRETGAPVRSLSASAASAPVPYGSFASVLPPSAEVVFGGAPLVDLARQAVGATAGGSTAYLAVDDAHHLDEPSATLVTRLLDSGGVAVLATMRSGEAAPPSVEALLGSDRTCVIEVKSFDRDGTATLAAELLGARLEAASAERLWRLTRGNALFVSEVLRAAITDGSVVPSGHGLVRLASLPTSTQRLADLVDLRVQGLSSDALGALTLVALGEPIGREPLEALTSPATVEELVANGVAEVRVEHRRHSVHLAHPLYGEVLRARTTPMRVRAASRRLADSLLALGARRRDDTMRLATLALDGGAPAPTELLVGAAYTARFAKDRSVAERLARAAFDADPTFANGYLLADVLYEGGTLKLHPELFDALAELATNDTDRTQLAMVRATTAFWHEADLAKSEAVMEAALASMPPSPQLDELESIRATIWAGAGLITKTLERAPSVDRGPDRALVQTALALSHALRLSGRGEEAIAVTDRALEVMSQLGDQVGLFTNRLMLTARTMCLADLGRFEEGIAAAREALRLSNSESPEANLGLARSALGWCQTWVGDLEGAMASYREAAAAFAAAWHPGMRRWAVGGILLAAVKAGDLESARAARVDLDALGPHPARLQEAGIERARAGLEVAEGFPELAVDRLQRVAVDLKERGDRMGEAGVLADLAVLGHRDDVIGRLRELAAIEQGTLVTDMLRSLDG